MRQTYSNIEVILVDDGSPDGCGAVCDAYAERDSRVTVIHKKNGGLSDARNTGIAASHGAWLSFVDSDDFIESDMLEKLHDAALREHAQMAVCNVDFYMQDDFFGKSMVNSTDYGLRETETRISCGAERQCCRFYHFIFAVKIFL